MAVNPECALCMHLSDCKDVTERMIVNQEHCRLFKATDPVTLEARESIIREFGLAALRYELPHRKQLSARPKSRRRKRHV